MMTCRNAVFRAAPLPWLAAWVSTVTPAPAGKRSKTAASSLPSLTMSNGKRPCSASTSRNSAVPGL